MGAIIDNIKLRFKQKDLLIQLISINVIVFLIIIVLNLITTLFKINNISFLEYVAVSADIDILIKHIWTIITYMFVHENLWHILFNMLMLFWFGQIFQTYFSTKSMGSLYIMGGLAGAALYIIAFNTIPLFIDMRPSLMIGASASVTAIVFASAVYKPNFEIGLLIIGRVKIIYVALFILVLDIIALGNESNPGGHVAHIGGAIVGYIYAKQYLKGRDITKWISNIIDFCANLFKPRPEKKIKVKYKRKESDYDYNQRRHKESVDIDQILDKIKSSGYSSLSKDEKKKLFDASKK